MVHTSGPHHVVTSQPRSTNGEPSFTTQHPITTIFASKMEEGTHLPQNIHRPPRLPPPPRKSLHRAQLRIINLPPLNRTLLMPRPPRPLQALLNHTLGMLLMLRRLPAREHQVRAPCCELQRGFTSDAVVAAGDNDPFACEVFAGDVGGG